MNATKKADTVEITPNAQRVIETAAVTITVTTLATCTLVLLPLAVASFGPFTS